MDSTSLLNLEALGEAPVPGRQQNAVLPSVHPCSYMVTFLLQLPAGVAGPKRGHRLKRFLGGCRRRRCGWSLVQTVFSTSCDECSAAVLKTVGKKSCTKLMLCSCLSVVLYPNPFTVYLRGEITSTTNRNSTIHHQLLPPS